MSSSRHIQQQIVKNLTEIANYRLKFPIKNPNNPSDKRIDFLERENKKLLDELYKIKYINNSKSISKSRSRGKLKRIKKNKKRKSKSRKNKSRKSKSKRNK